MAIIKCILESIKFVISSEVFWTIISGVVVFVLCQICVEIWLKPLQQYKKLRQSIATMLVGNAPLYSNALQLADTNKTEVLEKYEQVFSDTRKIAAELRGFIEIVPFFHLGIPSKRKLYEVSRELIGLSNGAYKPYKVNDRSVEQCNTEFITKIKKNLKIYGYRNN